MSHLSDFENSVFLPFRNVDSAHFIDVYMREGGYAPLFDAHAGEKISKARFVTRYGKMLDAYWKRMVLPPTRPRALLTNLASIEPGMFTTKRLVARNPHGLIEGMLLAARSVGADHGVIVTALEDSKLAATLQHALDESRKEKLWGEKANWSFDLRQIRLPQSALYAHDSFLLSALHGKRPGYPNRMEFLFGEPVHIHRPEEFYAFSWIERFDEEAFALKGSLTTPGMHLIAVSGNVAHPIVVEVPGGTLVRDIMSLAGVEKHISYGWFRFGGALGKWLPWEQAKELRFELTSGPLQLKKFQYPAMQWFDQAGAAAAKRATSAFTANQSCGACLACSHADHGLEKWSDSEKSNFIHLAKCSFFERSVVATKGPAW